MSIFSRAWSSVKDLFAGVGVTEEEGEAALIAAGIEAELLALADEVEEYWKNEVPDGGWTGAPVFGRRPTRGRSTPGADSEGEYRDSIHIEVTAERGFPHIKVGSALLPLAEWLEYGSIHNPEHGYMERTVEHFRTGGEIHIPWNEA